MERLIYKVLTAEQWAAAEAGGPVKAPIDDADGYVHLSTASQLQETLDKWFRGVEGCVLAEFDAEDFARELKWEKSRGGELFPHVYGRINAGQARALWLLEMGPNGAPLAPEEIGRRRTPAGPAGHIS
jgi:uncharacterized protein (DUF952 family)